MFCFVSKVDDILLGIYSKNIFLGSVAGSADLAQSPVLLQLLIHSAPLLC